MSTSSSSSFVAPRFRMILGSYAHVAGALLIRLASVAQHARCFACSLGIGSVDLQGPCARGATGHLTTCLFSTNISVFRDASTRNIAMEMIDLSGKFLLQAMFEKLDLPEPHYYVRALEQGGYRSEIEFYPSTELLHHGCKPVSMTSSVCKDRASSLNNVAATAIRRCQKVLVDYNYTKLQQAQDINASLTDSVTQKDKVIKEQKQQIRELSMEWSDYLDEVRIASDQIHQLSATGLDPNTQVTSHRLKKALAEVHDKIVALQQLTGMSSLSLQRKLSCPYGGESASAYDGASVDDLPDGYNASDLI